MSLRVNDEVALADASLVSRSCRVQKVRDTISYRKSLELTVVFLVLSK